MRTPFRFTTFARVALALCACLFALGTFDTAQAQNLTVSTSTLAFTAAQGGNPNPPYQTITTTSNPTGVRFTVAVSANTAWLSAVVSSGGVTSTSGTAGDTVYVQVNSSNPALAAGNFSGTVTLTPNSGSPVAIAVSLVVTGTGTNTSSLTAAPSQLSFGYQLNHSAPANQTVLIQSTGVALPYSFTTLTAPTANCPQGWLQATGASNNTTPGTLTVGIVTAGLGPGTCTGNISVTSNVAGNGTTTALIGVTLFVSTSPLLNINVPSGLSSVTLQQGGRPVQFTVQVISSDPTGPLSFTAAVSSGSDQSWLALSYPPPGVTPSNINVQVTPGAILPVGTYQGSIVITSPSGLFNGSLTIPVTMILVSSSSVTVTPSGTQNFSESQGGALPAPQTLTLSGATGSTFLATVAQQTGGAWLQVTPQSGSLTASTPGTLTLSVAQNALAQGTYSSIINITFQNSAIPPVSIPVSLTVGAPASAIVATPSTVAFSYQSGGATPAAQSIAISNPAAVPAVYTVASISDSWLSVSPSTGNIPGNINVSVNPQSLSPGSYTSSFTLTSPGLATVTVSVSLFVSASSTPQPFIIGNAASGVGGQLSPGEIISIKGSGLGPGTPVSFSVNTLTSPTLAGVQVTFDGYSGTLLYVSSTQINVTVPYEIAGRQNTIVVVTYQGVPSAGIVQPVSTASLGLFTNNATGSGQAAVVNQNYTYNTATTPALQGSYIAVYATGGGQTIPASTTGQVSPTTSLLPLALQQSVSATIAGRVAPVVFAGASPGYVTGVVQFNVQVPLGVSGSALPIVISINGYTVSQSGATVAVQ